MFCLPGGEKAVKEPRRVALSLLRETFGNELDSICELATLQAFTETDRRLLEEMLERGLHTPFTSSAGRLFDAIASIIGVRQICRFEGQAAMELESLTHNVETEEFYPFELMAEQESLVIDWAPMVRRIVGEVRKGEPRGYIAVKFHNTLSEMMVKIATASGQSKIALSGGCFQNRYLTERAVKRLREEGFHPYWHQRVPPNDGGIALGQVAALSRLKPKSAREESAELCALQSPERY
jgi:hydrogenase maturation protein HypF